MNNTNIMSLLKNLEIGLDYTNKQSITKQEFIKKLEISQLKNKVIYGDSLSLIKAIPDNSIDTILTDPPYNIANKTMITKRNSKIMSTGDAWGNSFKDSWDNIVDYSEWLKSYLIESYRVMKDNSNLLLFIDRKYAGVITLISEQIGFQYKNNIYFEKTNPMPHIRKNGYRSTVEECIWLTKGKGKINFISQQEMKQLFKGSIGRKITTHPTEKYSWMIKPLIERHSDKGDTILDLFSGSGTISYEAQQLGRNFIASENNKEFYDLSKNRINQKDQITLNELLK